MSNDASYLKHNQKTWDTYVRLENRWTQPVSSQVIADARKGKWEVVLTPQTPVPRKWFGDIRGKDVLCLASAGGQQGPVFAAAGAKVTVYDLSPKQLEQDQMVAERESLDITTIMGDMADLSAFADASFDIIFHPVSNCFVADVKPVWKECARVIRKEGILMAGFCNPILYLFAETAPEWKIDLTKVQKIPYSDLETLTPEQKELYARDGHAFEFGHTLTDQIGEQIKAGFVIDGFYEDPHHDDENPLYGNIDCFIATRATRV